MALTCALTAAPAAAGPRVWQPKDGAVTEGEVEVHARPSTVYRALTEYAKWPALFSDIAWSAVKSGGRENAVIQFKSHTFPKPQHVRFRNTHNRLVRYELIDGPSGVKVQWETAIEPNADRGTTKIRIRLTVVVGGIYGWIVTKEKVRKYRESKMTKDVRDLAKHFPPPKPAPATAPTPPT
ncbi:MAG TPA: SRPBCC family protein [Polyangia bacterium]